MTTFEIISRSCRSQVLGSSSSTQRPPQSDLHDISLQSRAESSIAEFGRKFCPNFVQNLFRNVSSNQFPFWRIKTFWLLIATSLVFAPALQGFINFGVVWLQYVGFTSAEAAGIESMRRAGASIGFLCSGWVGDRFYKMDQLKKNLRFS